MIRISRTNGPDLEFEGQMVASVSSRDHKVGPTSWTCLRVWRTTKAKYVAVRERHRVDRPDDPVVEVHVVENMDQLEQLLGWSWLTKLLYGQMGHQRVERLD